MKRSAIILAMTMLAGCAPNVEIAKTLATDIKDNIYTTTSRVKEWALTPPPPKPQPLEVADAYCYRVLQDILCYHQAMAGWENRLVAYQGTHAQPPSPPTMQLLAKSKPDDSVLPVNRVASSKPVFTTLPTLPKEEKNTEQPVAGDASHEILGDPALAPEL